MLLMYMSPLSNANDAQIIVHKHQSVLISFIHHSKICSAVHVNFAAAIATVAVFQ